MIQEVVRWLSVRLVGESSGIVLARLFGSIAKGSHFPSDCDVLLVLDAAPDSSEWHALRSRIKELDIEFRQHFGVPLSITLMTTAEFRSLRDYVETLRPNVDFLIRP